MQFWLGGYSPDRGGSAEGIGVLTAGEPEAPSAGGPLAYRGTARAEVPSPTWLSAHPRLDVVYATLEAEGQVAAFERTGRDGLRRIGPVLEAGRGVCHAAVSPDGRFLVASCGGDGRVVRIELDATGRLSSRAEAAAAIDPHADEGARPGATPSEVDGAFDLSGRWDLAGGMDLAAASRALRAVAGEEFAHLVPVHEEPEGVGGEQPAASAPEANERMSRAHAAAFLPGGLTATTDRGFDLVRLWRSVPGGLRAAHEVALPAGSGPGRMVVHPSGHLYVLTEHSSEVFVLAPDESGRWRLVSGVLASTVALPTDTGAELASSRDGEFLYAGLRGSNTIAVLRVRGQGETLDQVALVDSGVDWPRHHLVVRDILLVAGERSSDVVSLTLDIRSGVPGRVRHRTSAPSPTCLLLARP